MIKSKVNNKNYAANYDRIFGGKAKPIKTIEQLDQTLLDRTKKVLTQIIAQPELAKNPVVMMAVDHINEEIEQITAVTEEVIDEVTEEVKPLFKIRRKRKKDKDA